MDTRILDISHRTDPATCAALAALGAATVHESAGRQGLADPALRPVIPGASIAGPAVTVLNHPGDNTMIHAGLAMAQPGDVLVVTSTTPSVVGVIGENLTTCAMQRGIVGIVVDGAVRDTAALRRLGLPVWSRAVCAAGAVRATPGWVNVPVALAGVVVRPGDVIVADDDGVQVVQPDEISGVVDRGRAREQMEAENMKRYLAGELSLDIMGMRAQMREMGLPDTAS
jgi:4-hydroxy-4-methyl-2-oxoglutarate aldolase